MGFLENIEKDLKNLTKWLTGDKNASKKKAVLIKDHLKENNVSDELLARLHSPAGLDINAQTAEEIGLSIMSEILMHRNSGSGEPMGN